MNGGKKRHMYKIRIISCYFGELKPEFYLWLNSCGYNKFVDFLFVTDQKIDSNICPENVTIKQTTLNAIKKVADEIFKFNVELSTPYKLCDYKVAYGLIFQEELKQYDFWGYCDSDMVLGNIRKYITDEILNEYDKILPLGHLSIYRNTDEINRRFMECPNIMDYHEVFSSPQIYQFDETPGIYTMYKKRNWRMLEYIPFLDIVSGYNQRLTKYVYAKRMYGVQVQNHTQQIFCFARGEIIEKYRNKKNKLCENGYIYIHSSKRHYQCPYNEIPKQYVFMPDKICETDNVDGIDNLSDYSKIINCTIEKMLLQILTLKGKVNNKIRLLVKGGK